MESSVFHEPQLGDEGVLYSVLLAAGSLYRKPVTMLYVVSNRHPVSRNVPTSTIAFKENKLLDHLSPSFLSFHSRLRLQFP